MKKTTFQMIAVCFFLYLIGELYWLNDGENYELGRALNIALLIVLGIQIIYEDFNAFRIWKSRKKDEKKRISNESKIDAAFSEIRKRVEDANN